MPSRAVRILPLALLLVPGAASAQSLKLSRAAASPVSEDSIYALRVDSAAYPGHDVVLLLDEVTVKAEADGRYVYTLHRVVQLLNSDAVDNWGQITFWYNKDRQRATLNHLRVIGPDGKILQDGPAHREDVNPPADQGAPEITDRRGIQVTVGSLAPGVLIDYSYTAEKLKPPVAGDFSYFWDINGEPPIRRSRFTLDAPVTLKANVRTRNLAGDPVDTVIAGRRIRHWDLADLPSVNRQRYAGSPNGVQAWIWVSGNVTWKDIGNWYDSLATGRYELPAAVLTAHAQQLKGAKTLTDSLSATYRWVSQDMRYVSLSLGDGSYQPRTPREVFDSRFGDCKDKATMFIALARHMGVTAYPVLLSSDGGVDSLQPSIAQFDHMIAAAQYGGTTHYLDLTDPLLPFGVMETAQEGEIGLALPATGPRVVVFPPSSADSNWHNLEVGGGFGADGRFIGHLTLRAGGTEQGNLRDELAGLGQKEPAELADAIRKHVTELWQSATVDSQRYTDGHDLRTPVNLTVWFTAPRIMGRLDNGKYYFNLPFGRFVVAEDLNKLDGEGARRYPIDIGQVNSPSIYRMILDVQLPEGWQAELPHDATVQGPFGFYRARYSQAGRTLHVSREMGGARGVLPPDSIKALHQWLASVEADRTGMIELSRGTGEDLLATGTTSTITKGDLPDLLLGATDVSNDAKVTQEGTNEGSSDFLTVSSTQPLESYHRSFGPRQTLFNAGSTRLIALQSFAAAYHSAPEAQWMIDALGMFDIPRFLMAYVRQQGAAQDVKIDTIRTLSLTGIGDKAAGWVFQISTPLTTLDLGMVVATRNRVSESMLAVGLKGMQDSDMINLFRLVDTRVGQQDAYKHDVAKEIVDTTGDGAVDSALRASTSLALGNVAPPAVDSPSTIRSLIFRHENGWPQYETGFRGKAFTFPFGKAAAAEIKITVTQHKTPAQAVQQVLALQRENRKEVMQEAAGDVVGFGSLFVDSTGTDTTNYEVVTESRIGEWSAARHAKLRGMLRSDLEDVVFARGAISVKVKVTRPSGQTDMAATVALANDVLRRLKTVDPSGSETAPSGVLVSAIAKVVDADHQVDSLAEAKKIDAAFSAMDAADLAKAPVTFNAQTWNSLCWWGSLNGQAKRAQAACDAAVAADTTDLAIRDSRGLQRALAGDLNGARDDFAYIVANVAPGAFKDRRSQWLSTLREGKNPFTPALVDELKK
ncbi:MAG TPA: DUF3857 domain-containing protein [Gemmatimonadales bacterium]|nr:DUF3857 domain-containing protein [Gemmatimonadales bacterium]